MPPPSHDPRAFHGSPYGGHPGYRPPSPSPWAYGPPPPQARGVPTIVWVLVVGAIVGISALGAIFALGIAFGARRAASTESSGEQAANLPAVHRDVPVHAVSILAGCSPADRALIEGRIGDAIDLGAPTYNAGDFQGCYSTYDHAALSIEASLSASCQGPAKALATGRAKAQAKIVPSDRAWAMRDAFDGLLDVIERAPR